MSIELKAAPEDDPDFIARVEQILWGVLLTQRVEECVLVRIDNWFDHKWLGFSGKRVIPFPSARAEVALAEFHNAEVTLPPFSPGRVVSTRAYRWEGYLERFISKPLRRAVHRNQRSQKNLRRYAAELGPSIALVWFTGRSATNRRGSLMVYTCREGEVEIWYSSWALRDGWVIDHAKGISHDALEELRGRGHATLEERRHQLPDEEQALCDRLHQAIADSRMSDALDWVAGDVNLEGRDREGRTALLHAVEVGSWDLVDALLRVGANPFQQDLMGWGVLHSCAGLHRNGDALHALEAFLSRGVSTEARMDSGRTPLIVASQKGDLDAARLLLEHGANQEAHDLHRLTALHHAALERRPEMTTLLLDAGARVGSRNRVRFTPLAMAAWSGDAESLRLLHKAGANLSPKDKWDCTPLSWARHRGKTEAVEALLELGAQDE